MVKVSIRHVRVRIFIESNFMNLSFPPIFTLPLTFMKNQNLLSSITKATKSSLTHKQKPTFPSNFSTLSYTNHADKIYTQNRTLNKLIKSGSLTSALKLFDEMPHRDVITYNTLISGYHRSGFLKQSLTLYNHMVSQGIVENSSTFSTVLSVCTSGGFFTQGLIVHCRAIVLGLSGNVYIGSAIIDLYFQMGCFDIGLRLFSSLKDRNLATWNVVLRGFCEPGRGEWMLRMYDQMRFDDGVEPNGVSFCYLIKGCGYERLIDGGTKLHCCVIKNGLVCSNLFVANALVDFYSACGRFSETVKSFEVIASEDVVSWNSMVLACASSGCLFDAFEIFQRMLFYGSKPSVCSFLGFVKLSSAIKDIVLGKQIHCCVLKLAFETPFVQSSLIDMYGKCGDIESSVRVFDTVPERTLESCNALMTSLLRFELIEDVIELFRLMVDENIGYDQVSLSSALKALSASGTNSTTCYLLHSCAVKSGLEYDVAVSCSLIDSYSKYGEVKLSRQIFNQISYPSVFSFTSMIGALARNGMGMECLEMFSIMIQNGLKPDKVTFLSVLMGCNHSGLVEEGRLIFYSMYNDHGLSPERQHYSCMVDLLGRAGLLDEVEELLNGTPWEGDFAIWSSILRSCRIHHNERVGKRAAYMLMELEPENPAGWLQASKFYSNIGDFETMKHLQEVGVGRKIRKEIGKSMIEVYDVV